MLKSILNIPLATAFAQSNIDAVDDSTALNITQVLHYHYVKGFHLLKKFPPIFWLTCKKTIPPVFRWAQLSTALYRIEAPG